MSSNIQLLNRRRYLSVSDGAGNMIRFIVGKKYNYNGLNDTVTFSYSENWIPLNGLHTIYCTVFVGLDPIYVDLQANGVANDARNYRVTNYDTQGRALRVIDTYERTAYLAVNIDAENVDDYYLWDNTDQKYLVKGANIPDDYIPELAS